MFRLIIHVMKKKCLKPQSFTVKMKPTHFKSPATAAAAILSQNISEHGKENLIDEEKR